VRRALTNRPATARAFLIQVPDEFFRTEAETLGFSLPPQGHYGVGMFFLSRDKELQGRCEQTLAAQADAEGLTVLGWRDVPTDNRCLGELARNSEPVIRQAFFDGRGRKDEDLERRLYVVRKRTERRAREMLGEAADQFYVPSSRAARSSTRACSWRRSCLPTTPIWPTPGFKLPWPCVHQPILATTRFRVGGMAQPFRMIAHNGEINTLRGNTNRIRGRGSRWSRRR